MHILVVFEYGSINGGENSFLAVVDDLRERGHTFTALVEAGTPLERLLHTYDVRTLPLVSTDQNGTRLTQTDRRDLIADAIQTIKPDLVHANSLSMSRLCGPVCRSLGVPSLGYLRDIIKISRKAMDDINQLNCVVAVSDATRDFHVERGLATERAVTIYNGIHTSDRAPDALDVAGVGNTHRKKSGNHVRADLSLPDDARLLLSVGQIGMRKGLDTLVAAFFQLAANQPSDLPPLHLLIVGQRHSQKQEAIDYETNLLNRVRDSDFQHQIHWLNRRDDVADLMKQSVLLLHAARQEPLGRVLLEAGSVGLPIVATDVGGTAEILTDAAFQGCLVPKDDPTRLANAAQRLLNDNLLRANLSQLIHATIRERFSVQRCASQLHTKYKTLVRQ